MLVARARKRSIAAKGEMEYSPLHREILRVLEDSYMELAAAKRQEEVRPCEIIIKREPLNLHGDNKNRLRSMRAMWLTEAYAIIDFKSGWRVQIIAVIREPVALIDTIR